MANRNGAQIQTLTATQENEGSLVDYALYIVATFAFMTWFMNDVVIPMIK